MLWILVGCHLFEPREQPNVVLIVVDTLRADHVGLYGAKNATTPNLDRLGAEGQYFERAYAHSGWTLPSFASIFTGLYPSEHEVVHAYSAGNQFGKLAKEKTTMAELFLEQGYQTAAVVNNTFLAPEFGLDQGFQEYFYQGADNLILRSAKETTDTAIQWWKENEGNKFLVIHYMEPHQSLNPPETTRGAFLKEPYVSIPFTLRQAFPILNDQTQSQEEKQRIISDVLELYDEEILAVDLEIPRLQEVMSENTVFVFTSDHGEEFWEHGGFEHGHSLKSELTRIPLVVWGKDIPKKGKIAEVVSHVDLFHSITHLANLVPPLESHGTDILTVDHIPEKVVLSENTLYGDPMISVVDNRYRLELNQKKKMATLWSLDRQGMEKEIITENSEQTMQPYLRFMAEVRGSLDVFEQGTELNIPSQEAFQQLKKLGYMDE